MTSRPTTIVLLCTALLMTFLEFADARVAVARHGDAAIDAREHATLLRGEIENIWASIGEEPERAVRVGFEWTSGPGDPDRGASFETPDLTCDIWRSLKGCSIEFSTFDVGTDEIHVWILGHPRDANETPDETDDDTTDVVERTWQSECDFYTPTIVGTNSGETLRGTHDRDVIDGRGGDDVILGNSGEDVICGGGGADELRGGSDSDRITGGTGSDFIVSVCRKRSERDFLMGGAGGDRLRGFDSETRCHQDVVPGPGRDYVLFATGNASVLYNYLRTSIEVDLGKHEAFAQGRDILRGVDAVYGGFGDDSIVGDDSVNYFEGGEGEDVLRGGPGRDFLEAGDVSRADADRDRLFGGPNNDYLTGVTDDSLFGGHGSDDLDGASLLNGGSGDDDLDCDPLVPFCVARGGRGNDTITGSRHADRRLAGGDGDDLIQGEKGSDLLVGGEGHDELRDAAGHDRLEGREGNDLMLAGNNKDVLVGGHGRDRLLGGAHEDRLYGGANNDHLFGEAGFDFCVTGFGRDQLDGCERVHSRGSNPGDDASGDAVFDPLRNVGLVHTRPNAGHLR